MKKKMILSRILSVLLAFVLLMGNVPMAQMPVFAVEGTENDGLLSGIGKIISFEELSPDIMVQNVPTGTQESELNLPDILVAKVSFPAEGISTEGTSPEETSVVTDSAISLNIQDEQNQIIGGQIDTEEEKTVSEPVTMNIPVPVTWTSSPAYDGDAAGIYIFTPAIEGFTVSAELPVITVTVDEAINTKAVEGEITEFRELPEDIRWQNTMSPVFPETVEGIVNGMNVQIPVTWEADHRYDADNPQRGLYVFTAVLGDDYEAAYGTELPRITVYIPQNAGVMMRMAGSGTTESPLEIYTASQLAEIATLVNSKPSGLERFLFNNSGTQVHLKLMNDIDLSDYQSGEGWVSIGNWNNPFKSIFDGNNKVIIGLKINRSGNGYYGLFGYINGGTVRNLGVINVNLQGGAYAGGVAGYLTSNGIIENCYSTGSISNERSSCFVGGVVGSSFGTVRNCYSTCSISATSSDSCYVGGVAGSSNGSIDNCYSTSSVSGTASNTCYVGGVVGSSNGNIVNCYSIGSVSGSGGNCNVGGVVGTANSSSVMNCAALNSSISGGASNVGRVVGSSSGTLSSNYTFSGIPGSWNDKVHDRKNGADKTAESLVQSAFWKSTTNWNNSPWDEDIWNIENYKLPTLKGLSGQDGAIPAHINAKEFAGMGTSGNPYLIKTAADLANLAQLVNTYRTPYNESSVHFKLENNIDLSDYQTGEGWTPIGTGSSPFRGTFDGNNKVISGLKINRPDNEKQGLFGNIYGGTVKNLGVTNIDITGKAYVGGVAAYINNNGNVEYCYTTGDVTATGTDSIYCGGVAGYVSLGTIQNCYSACDISTSNNRTGGIVGYINNGTVKNCYSTGDIRSGGSYLGGVAGYLSGSTVENCYTTGIISSITGAAVGGIAGYVYSSSTIINCVALNSSVSGSFGSGDYVGRIAGLANNGCTLSDNYAYSGMTVKGTSPYDSSDTYYKLENNIDLSAYGEDYDEGEGWIPIGKQSHFFRGIFDGNNKVITGLYINRSDVLDQGLFGWIHGGTVKNLGVKDVDIILNGTQYLGAVAGRMTNYAKIENCYVTGSISGTAGDVGGVAGYVDNSFVKRCYSACDVNSDGSQLGGVVGYLVGGTLQYCYSTGSVSSTNECVGGVVGTVTSDGTVQYCYSTGSVSSTADDSRVGGVLGYGIAGTIKNCAALNASIIGDTSKGRVLIILLKGG